MKVTDVYNIQFKTEPIIKSKKDDDILWTIDIGRTVKVAADDILSATKFAIDHFDELAKMLNLEEENRRAVDIQAVYLSQESVYY
jgi:hypothetical protein